MTIHFSLSGSDEELTSIEMESNPFKINDVIRLKIVNKDACTWDVRCIDDEFIVESVSYFVDKTYSSKIFINVFALIELKPLKA